MFSSAGPKLTLFAVDANKASGGLTNPGVLLPETLAPARPSLMAVGDVPNRLKQRRLWRNQGRGVGTVGNRVLLPKNAAFARPQHAGDTPLRTHLQLRPTAAGAYSLLCEANSTATACDKCSRLICGRLLFQRQLLRRPFSPPAIEAARCSAGSACARSESPSGIDCSTPSRSVHCVPMIHDVALNSPASRFVLL